jgi:carboxylesterase
MTIHKIPPHTTVNPFGRTLHFAGGAEAVLILHGFTGRTANAAYLASRLHERGYTVRVPRLPGHGTNGADFSQSGWRDWLRRSVDEYLELAALHSRVSVVGMSMGGVLTLILASRFPVSSIVLCAPAIQVRNRWIWLIPLVGRLKPRGVKPFYEAESSDPDERNLEDEYHRYTWYRQIAEFRRLQRIARRRLRFVTAPTLTLVSKADDTVPPAAASYIREGIAAAEQETVTLANSGHVIINDVEREAVADATLSWIMTHSE